MAEEYGQYLEFCHPERCAKDPLGVKPTRTYFTGGNRANGEQTHCFEKPRAQLYAEPLMNADRHE